MGLAVPYTSYNRRWDPTNTSWGRELFWKPWKIEYDIPLTTHSLPSLWRPWRNNLSQQMSVSLYIRSIALSNFAHPSVQTFLRFISCDWKLSEVFISQIQFILFSGAVEFKKQESSHPMQRWFDTYCYLSSKYFKNNNISRAPNYANCLAPSLESSMAQ